MKPSKYVLSCDWFAYSCLSKWSAYNERSTPKLHDVITYHALEYEVCETKESHPLFACSALIRLQGVDICHLFWENKRKAVGSSGRSTSFECIAKVANSLLYTRGWADTFRNALAACQWVPVRVQRVDICCDFEYFANGRLPMQFARDYLSEPRPSRASFIRRGSNKYRVVGERSVSANRISTISWGTRDSPVQVNMYNKTLELQEVHMKPWIVAKWEQNGLQSGKDDAGKIHYIWRVEMSVNPSSLAFRSKNREQVSDWSLAIVSTQAQLMETWRIMLPRYFQFYYLTAAAKRARSRVRELTPVVLFDEVDASNVVPMTLNRSVSSGRTERILAKKLEEIRDKSFDEKVIEAAACVRQYMIEKGAIADSKDVATTEDLLGHFIYGLKDANSAAPEVLRPLSKAAASRQAMRYAKLLLCGKASGFADFDAAAFLAQDLIEDMRVKASVVISALPEDAFS